MNREQVFQRELISGLRQTLSAMLQSRAYRNAGEMPHYEDPIRTMMTALNWQNLGPEQTGRLTGVVLAIFDNIDYPGRGTMPAIEALIHQMMQELTGALTRNLNRILALDPAR